MQTIGVAAAERTWTRTAIRPAVTAAQLRAVALMLIVVSALVFRATDLATSGLSDDESNKILALEQYRAGHFAANAEHPMLMKLAMWGSVALSRQWNRVAPEAAAIALETAIRLPNAVAGAATTVAIYGAAQLLFGPTVAITAAALWAFDVNAIAINRIGKEDTFLLFFFVLAVWMYERAKREGREDPSSAQRWYAGSGAAFGLMLASKYMPHLFGIYALFNVVTDPRPGANKPEKLRYYAAMAVAFALANAAVFLPETWRYLWAYVRGGTLAHHGYLYAGRLYVTNIPVSPLGVPASYYARLIATKVPLAVLAALVPGVIELFRRRRERGFVLLRVLLVFLLVPYSLMAAKFIRYSLPMLATIDLIAAVGFVAGIRWLLRKSWLPRPVRAAVSIAAFVVAAVSLAADRAAAAPFYSVFQNAIGERVAAPGATFPEEFYDYGVREAAFAIGSAAHRGADVVTDTPAVVSHYLTSVGRTDLRVRSLSHDGIRPAAPESWVIVQQEHATFENEEVVRQLQQEAVAWTAFRAGDLLSAQVFRLERGVHATTAHR